MSKDSSIAASPIEMIIGAARAAWNEVVEVVGVLIGLFGFLAMLSFGLHGL